LHRGDPDAEASERARAGSHGVAIDVTGRQVVRVEQVLEGAWQSLAVRQTGVTQRLSE
jgi:hypothetical protein